MRKRPDEIDFPFSFNEPELWALSIEPEEVNIDFLADNLDVLYLDKEGTDDWNLSPRQLLQNLDAESGHREKMEKADLSYPIEIYNFKGRWRILDGVHRYCKALRDGRKTILVRKVTDDVLSSL